MAKTKSVNGKDLPASCFLYVPDPNEPSTWKLPVKHPDGTPDPGLIARAAAALSPGGYRGNPVDMPMEDKMKAKKKLIALYKRIGRDPKDIPGHLMEHKALPDSVEESAIGLYGEIKSIAETEYKGQKGLIVEAIMNSLTVDFYHDHAILTPELKSSTDSYFESGGWSMIEHGLPYRGKSPVKAFVGKTIFHDYTDDGIFIRDFVPLPNDSAPAEIKRAYDELKSGEFEGISVGGTFWRDSGVHKPPGLIFDWDLDEHSYCKYPVDGAAPITSIAEVKAMVQECTENCAYQPLKETTPAPATEQKNLQDTTPTAATIPAAPSGGHSPMNETVAGTSNPAETQNLDLVQNLMARLEALESEKKAQEEVAAKLEREKKANELAESKAREIAEAKAREEAEFNALVDQKMQVALSRYQIQAVGSRFTMPNVNFGAQQPTASTGGRWSMAGLIPERKSLFDARGNEIPGSMIQWLQEVKSGQRFAENHAWLRRFGDQGHEIKTVATGVPTAATFSPVGASGGFALPAQYLQDIIPALVAQDSIRSLITVYPASSILLQVPKMAIAATRAVVTAENALKPKTDIGTDMIPIRLYTIPRIIDLPNQLLDFSPDTAEQALREQLTAAIRLAEYYYALQGSGSGEPYGLIPALTANQALTPSMSYVVTQGSGTDPLGAAVPADESLPDFIARGINVTQLRFYQPTALLVNPSIWWKLITTKDLQGRYLVDANMTGSVNSVWGLRVQSSTQIPVGKGIVGDWTKLRMYVAGDVTIDMTREGGERFDRNQTGFRIEEMMGLNAEQELNAFTELDFDLT